MFSYQWVWPPFAALGWAWRKNTGLNSGSQPSDWGSEELDGEEKAGESDKSEPEDPSCFYRPASLLHWRRYLRNLKRCCGICFWASGCRMCLVCPCLVWWGCWHSRTFGGILLNLALLRGPSAYGNALSACKPFPPRASCILLCFAIYPNWCITACRLSRKYKNKDTVLLPWPEDLMQLCYWSGHPWWKQCKKQWGAQSHL